MKPLGLPSSALDVKPARINEIVRERRGISADTALRLGRFFRTDVQSWMNLQTQYDIQCGEDAAGGAFRKIASREDEVFEAQSWVQKNVSRIFGRKTNHAGPHGTRLSP